MNKKDGLNMRVTFFVILVTLLFSLPNIFAQKGEMQITTSSKDALKAFLDGREKADHIEFTAAAKLFEKAIKEDPNFALAYLFLAQTGGGFNVSQQNLNEAVKLADNVTKGERHFILLVKALNDGDIKEQNVHMKQLLSLFPNDKRIQHMAGLVNFVNNDYSKALGHFNKAEEIDKNFAATYNMKGYCEMRLGKMNDAGKSFEKYISLVPNKPNPYDSYAEYLMKMGKYDESIKNYKIALDKDPEFISSWAGIGDDYVFKGDFETARDQYQKYFNKASRISEKLNALYLNAVSYVHEGKIDQALRIFDKYRSLAQKENLIPNEIYSHRYQALILLEKGRVEEGRKHCQMAYDLVQNSNLPDAAKEYFTIHSSLWRVHSLIANNDLEKAKTELEQCQKMVMNRNNPEEIKTLHAMYGLFEMQNGNNDKTLEYFSKADNEDPLVKHYIALTHEKKDNIKAATAMYENIVKWNENGLNYALVRQHAIDKINNIK